MKRQIVKGITVVLILSMLLSGCGQKVSVNEEPEVSPTPAASDTNDTPEEIPIIEEPPINDEPIIISPTEDDLSEGGTIEEYVPTAWDRWAQDDNKEACKKVSFSPSTSVVTTNGNMVTDISAADADGKTIHMSCVGVTLSDDGNYFVLEKTAKMYLTDALGGIKYMDMVCEENGDAFMCVDMMYAITGKTSIQKEEELTLGQPAFLNVTNVVETSFMPLPNYLRFSVDELSQAKIQTIDLYYTGDYTGIKSFYLNPRFYRYYMPGEKYNAAAERFAPEQEIWDFYVNARIDSPYIEEYDIGNDIYAIDNVTPGNLHRADGTIKSKDEYVEEGDYLDFTFDGMTFNLDTFFADPAKLQNYHEAMSYVTMEATGDLHVMVLPVIFADQEWTKADEEELKSALGRVAEGDGTVKEYAPFDGEETLSSYFDQASYGKLRIDSFIAAPYEFSRDWGEDYTFDIGRDSEFSGYVLDCFANWLNEQYDDLSRFDRDGNGLFDALYIVNPGDMSGYTSYYSFGMAGAMEYRASDGPEHAGMDDKMGANYISYCPLGFLHDGNVRGKDDYDIGTFVHEFSHALGVADYYDTSYKGISSLGGFDMQDDNNGDWNAFSKYAVGWANPTIVLPSEIDAKGSIELTIDAYTKNGSCIVIPTSRSEADEIAETPFAEYILLDLFTDDGLYRKDAAKYGLSGAVGVRMYHVDARHETRNGILLGEPYSFALPYRTNRYNVQNRYLITLIQAGGIPKLINPSEPDMNIGKDDLFTAGSTFSAEKFAAYFTGGRMNDRSEFPYTITVKSIEDDRAVIIIGK